MCTSSKEATLRRLEEEKACVVDSQENTLDVGYDPIGLNQNRIDSNIHLVQQCAPFCTTSSQRGVYWRHVAAADWDLKRSVSGSGNVSWQLGMTHPQTKLFSRVYNIVLPFSHAFEVSIDSAGTMECERFLESMKRWSNDKNLRNPEHHYVRLGISTRAVESIAGHEEVVGRRNQELMECLEFLRQIVRRYILLRVRSFNPDNRDMDAVDIHIIRMKQQTGLKTDTDVAEAICQDELMVKPLTFNMRVGSARVGVSTAKRLVYSNMRNGEVRKKPRHIAENPLADELWETQQLELSRVRVVPLFPHEKGAKIVAPENSILAPAVSLTFNEHKGVLHPKLKLGDIVYWTGQTLQLQSGNRDEDWQLDLGQNAFPTPETSYTHSQLQGQDVVGDGNVAAITCPVYPVD